MEIFEKVIAGRAFLFVGTDAIPVDRIKSFDLHAANGGASDNSVRIVTDDPDDGFIWAYENADALREYLLPKPEGD